MRKVWTKEDLIAFEDHIGDLYMDNQLPFLFHLSGGNEDQLIDIFKDISLPLSPFILAHPDEQVKGLTELFFCGTLARPDEKGVISDGCNLQHPR